ncbi:hypothetical protein QEP77_00995 [Serratia sp. B1]|nr:hypothetical protein QEP77_00995 [Serratia sp. B1]
MVTLKHNLEEIQQIAKERTVKTQTIEYDLETLVKKIKKELLSLTLNIRENIVGMMRVLHGSLKA